MPEDQTPDLHVPEDIVLPVTSEGLEDTTIRPEISKTSLIVPDALRPVEESGGAVPDTKRPTEENRGVVVPDGLQPDAKMPDTHTPDNLVSGGVVQFFFKNLAMTNDIF
jgi:hypothetical protein